MVLWGEARMTLNFCFKNVPLEKECAEIREGVELSVEAHVPGTQFDAVLDIAILVILDESLQ